jgi:hypothetical protein
MSDRVVGESSVVIGGIRPADTASGSDADLAVITDYLAGELEPGEVAVVERRLRVDEGFGRRVEPLMAAWRLTEPVAIRPSMGDRRAFADLWGSLHDASQQGCGKHAPSLRIEGSARQTLPAPWWEVLPASWLLRTSVLGAAAITALGWLTYVVRKGQ